MDGGVLRARVHRARQDRERSYAQEYLSYFLNDEPSPGIEYEYRLVQQLLPGITLDGCHRRWRGRGWRTTAGSCWPSRRRRPASACRPRASCRRRIGDGDKVARHAVERQRRPTRALVENMPAAGAHRVAPRDRRHRRHGRQVRQRRRSVAEADRLQERPGALHDVRAGRRVAGVVATTSCKRRFATPYVGLSGVGGIKALDLEKLLAGKLASASPVHRRIDAGHLTASAAPADLETALQLLYQEFTRARRRPGGASR